MKITIRKVDGVWHYAVENDESTIATGERETFFGCCAKCLELVDKYRWNDEESEDE